LKYESILKIYIYKKFTLTPSYCTKLEDIIVHVGIEHLDQCEVHVYRLQAHPGEGGQQEIVEGCSGGDA